jgi:hypothetical protein
VIIRPRCAISWSWHGGLSAQRIGKEQRAKARLLDQWKDLQAERRLLDAEALGRAREVQFFGNGDKITGDASAPFWPPHPEPGCAGFDDDTAKV